MPICAQPKRTNQPTDFFIRVPAVAARDLPALNRAVDELARALQCRYAGETTRRIGHVVVLESAR